MAAYNFEEFRLDPVAFAVTRAGQPLPLEPKAFDLLRYFVEHPNRTLTKRELLDAIWKDVAVTENVLARAVLLVRKALGDQARASRFVQTIPTRGYRFNATVETGSDPAESTRRDRDASVGPISIAVLPFVNASRNAGDEHLSDGISEDILSALARDPDFRVAARSSSFAFKDRASDLTAIAARLRVAFVLDGSVRRDGHRIRITTHLVDVVSGFELWSERFDRELSDIFAVQEEIASSVAAAIRDVLGRQRASSVSRQEMLPQSLGRAAPRTLEAYEALLKGRYLSRQRFAVMEDARTCFQRAIALDPTFAPAYAALAEHYTLCGIYSALPSTEAFLLARRSAEEAHALAPASPDPYHVLAFVSLMFEWNLAACERHHEQALSLEPNHVGALISTALLRAVQHRPADAWTAIERGLTVDPLGADTRTWMLAVAWLTSEFERMIVEAGRLIADHPGYGEAFRWRAMASEVLGDYAAARADLRAFAALTNTPLDALVILASVAALEGETTEARQILETMAERATRSYVPPSQFGIVEQQLGNYEAALDWYERAFRERDFIMAVLHVDPQFRIVPRGQKAPITEHPRWVALLRRIGVAREYAVDRTA